MTYHVEHRPGEVGMHVWCCKGDHDAYPKFTPQEARDLAAELLVHANAAERPNDE